MKYLLNDLGNSLQKISLWRDKVLLLFIEPYWPRKITPNHVSSVRIGVGILLFILLFGFEIDNKILIISLFLFGGLTDLLDGSIARGLNKVTELGATLDSTADRLLILPIAIYSLIELHWKLLLVLVVLELINACVSIYYKRKVDHVESNIFGKTKIFLLVIAFVIILIIWPQSPTNLLIGALWASAGFSVLSIISRILELKDKRHFKKNENI